MNLQAHDQAYHFLKKYLQLAAFQLPSRVPFKPLPKSSTKATVAPQLKHEITSRAPAAQLNPSRPPSSLFTRGSPL
jgi:hypothetical protein